MGYCTASQLNNRYGQTNVRAWADMEGLGYDENSTNIDARIDYAIVWATALIDARLTRSSTQFQIPITGTVPTLLADIAVRFAGYWLSTARGVSDYDGQGKPITRLQVDYDNALALLEQIASGDLFVEIS
jgi:phage gp36-like protein